MTQAPKRSTPPTGPVPPTPPIPPIPPIPQKQATPTEPAEVLGRHKNSGQKDHKGAR